MNAYTLAVLAYLLAAVAQTSASWIAVERFLAAAGAVRQRLAWAALAMGNVLLTLHTGYALELALRTGMYDLRQALLAAAVALCLVFGCTGLRSRTV